MQFCHGYSHARRPRHDCPGFSFCGQFHGQDGAGTQGSIDPEECKQFLDAVDPAQCRQLLQSLSPEQVQQLYESLTPDQIQQVSEKLGACNQPRPNAPEYTELDGHGSKLDPDLVARVSRQLRGDEPMKFESDACHRVRHADPNSPISTLSECGDERCGAHRLKQPEVRTRFRKFVTNTVRRAERSKTAWFKDGLRYASLGSGQLLWDCEMLERLRAEGLVVRQVCLIDTAYATSDHGTLSALQAFADWQSAVCQLWEHPIPEILAFTSSKAYEDHAGPDGVAAGCNLFMHCDAAWEGADEACWKLAHKSLVPSGILAKLSNLGSNPVPEEMLEKGPEPLRRYWQIQQEHSEEPFAAAAWTCVVEGGLVEIEDALLGEDAETKGMKQHVVSEGFKHVERSRGEKLGLEIWRVIHPNPPQTRTQPCADAPAVGQVVLGQELIAAERFADWIRIAGISDLWGVDYSARAKASMSHPQMGVSATDDSALWVPIDGSCLDMDSEFTGRFLKQVFVPEGREPWRSRTDDVVAEPRHAMSVSNGAVTIGARFHRLQHSWRCPLLPRPSATQPAAPARRRQHERLRWRSLVHELTGKQTRKELLATLGPEDRTALRAWVQKEERRWQGLATELASLSGWARKERLAQLGVEDRASFQQWLADQKLRKRAGKPG
eukprot:TRINITY_DN73817_c0_g1_i1.p1 TRINITY_DN73817_c0_g1~~TRINITY_DN73817_c0_g1_i1.p1  ORF type:complete len:666 (+),score=128.74 TRINITY_DN73817_c0_g1_i1:112-2109(+)